MTRHIIDPVPLLFPHEQTDLFTAVRELHMYGVTLERNVGPTRAITLLSTAAFHAMANIAAAGVAPTEKSQNLYLDRVRRQLAKCATSIIALRDRSVIERDSTLFGLRLVDRALEAAEEFRLEIEVIKSMKPPTEPRAPLTAEARAVAAEQRQAAAEVPSPPRAPADTSSNAAPAHVGTPCPKPQLVNLPGSTTDAASPRHDQVDVRLKTAPGGRQDRPNGGKKN